MPGAVRRGGALRQRGPRPGRVGHGECGGGRARRVSPQEPGGAHAWARSSLALPRAEELVCPWAVRPRGPGRCPAQAAVAPGGAAERAGAAGPGFPRPRGWGVPAPLRSEPRGRSNWCHERLSPRRGGCKAHTSPARGRDRRGGFCPLPLVSDYFMSSLCRPAPWWRLG